MLGRAARRGSYYNIFCQIANHPKRAEITLEQRQWEEKRAFEDAIMWNNLSVVQHYTNGGGTDTSRKLFFWKPDLLHRTVHYAGAEVARALMQMPHCSLNHQNSSGETPLYEAVRYRTPKIAAALLENPAVDVNLRAHNGQTPLHAALVFTPHMQILKNLLAREDVDLACPDKDGCRPTHLAVKHAKDESLRLILEAGKRRKIGVNAKNNEGKTPLHIAAEVGNKETVSCLLTFSNTQIWIKDNEGLTAKDLAKRRRHQEVAKVLKEFQEKEDLL